jgi:hypothetical protein
MKKHLKLLRDISRRVEVTLYLLHHAEESIKNTKDRPNVRWFKHKLDTPYMKTVNTFILTMEVTLPDDNVIDILKEPLDPSNPEHQRLHAMYGDWLLTPSLSYAFLLRDWDHFDVPVLEDLDYFPHFSEKAALNWMMREWYVDAELKEISKIESAKL